MAGQSRTSRISLRRFRSGNSPRSAIVFLAILSLTLVASGCPSTSDECYDPEVELPLLAPGAYEGYDPEPDLAGVSLGELEDRLYFDSHSDGTLQVMSNLADHMDRDGLGATVVIGELTIHIERGQPLPPPPKEEIRKSLTLRAETDIAKLDLIHTWTLTEDEKGEPRGALSDIVLVDPNNANAALDAAGLWLLANDPTCVRS